MELYKVLECKDGKLISPYQYYEYIPGKKMICSDFDTNELKDCSRGYYATDIDGLIYTFRNLPDCEVWKVEVGGKKVEFNQFKRRYEEITLIEEIPHEEVKRLALEWEPKVGYKLAEALFPVNPLLISMNGDVTASEIELVRQWDVILGLVWALIGVPVGDSIGDLVGTSVRETFGDLAWEAVGDSVWASVWDSVWTSVRFWVVGSVGFSVGSSIWNLGWAYISSLFPGIKKWKYLEHLPGENPFQSAIDLWLAGLVPSYDGKVWRLHAGENADVVWY